MPRWASRSGAPVASTNAAGLAYHQIRDIGTSIQDQQRFASALTADDPFGDTPAQQPAHRAARQGRHRRVRRELRPGRGPGLGVLTAGRRGARRRHRAAARGRLLARAARSSPRRPSAASAGWRTRPCSPGCGSTASSATTSSSRSDRFTLSDAFQRAGWRTVGDVPSNTEDWPEGQSFYHYDKIYDAAQRRLRGAEVQLCRHARPVHAGRRSSAWSWPPSTDPR